MVKAVFIMPLDYKQSLSLTMIRKFSELLHIPAEALVKEYDLKAVFRSRLFIFN